MRDELYEGEWLLAFEKGLSMIVSCREQKKPLRTEKIIVNYFRNLVKMSPFDFETTYKQMNIGLEKIDMWLSINNTIETNKFGHRYGRRRR